MEGGTMRQGSGCGFGLSCTISEKHFPTCYAPKIENEKKNTGQSYPRPPHAHPTASLAHRLVLGMCQFNQATLIEELWAALLTGSYFCFINPAATLERKHMHRGGAHTRGHIFFATLKYFYNDCSASSIWQGLHVNRRRREAAFWSDD